jgi:NMD protein affecting ribosome stability and mRNA decay
MKTGRSAYRYGRKQLLEGYGNDPYRPGRKPAGPVQCPRCRAVFRRGRWSWGSAQGIALKRRCPACQRIEDRFPAGYVSIAGGFWRAHRGEILALVKNCEQRESAEHPLERIMKVQNEGEGLLVTTTSVHLARLIGHALKAAFKGSLRLVHNKEDSVLRARWTRAASTRAPQGIST